MLLFELSFSELWSECRLLVQFQYNNAEKESSMNNNAETEIFAPNKTHNRFKCHCETLKNLLVSKF